MPHLLTPRQPHHGEGLAPLRSLVLLTLLCHGDAPVQRPLQTGSTLNVYRCCCWKCLAGPISPTATARLVRAPLRSLGAEHGFLHVMVFDLVSRCNSLLIQRVLMLSAMIAFGVTMPLGVAEMKSLFDEVTTPDGRSSHVERPAHGEPRP